MISYEEKALLELSQWQYKMLKKPSVTGRMAKAAQVKFNSLIPDKIHRIITGAIKNMVKVVLNGSEFTTKPPLKMEVFEQREFLVKERLNFYRKSATLTGAGTGAGGLIIGLADFPILLSLKMKFLYDTASFYGFDVGDYRERLYILYIFRLAFSSDEKRIEVYNQILNWESHVKELPININSFDWMTFQQEYRDYIDLAKMLQLVPVIGLFVGAYANHQLMGKLGQTAMNCYRLRLFRS